MIDLIRSQQLHHQYQQRIQTAPPQPIAQYQGRDNATGQRKLLVADGGSISGNYLSDTVPLSVPQYQPARLGLPGFIISN
jgi:hypothetical protein